MKTLKPYAVKVVIGSTERVAEFNTDEELSDFLNKAEELKKTKAPNLKVTIIREPDPRENSLCWEPIFVDGKPLLDIDGKQMYRCIPVKRRGKNILYCPYCLQYVEKKAVDLGYGLKVDGCEKCGMTVNDFYMKTANGLW